MKGWKPSLKSCLTTQVGSSLVIRWLGAFTAKGLGSIPGPVSNAAGPKKKKDSPSERKGQLQLKWKWRGWG